MTTAKKGATSVDGAPAQSTSTTGSAAGATHYHVLRGFTHEGTYYTNDNAAEIPEKLTKKDREDRVTRKYLEERTGAASPAPPAEPTE